MKYLYKKAKCSEDVQKPDGFSVEVFTPSIWNGLTLPGEEKRIKTLAVRFLFQFMTLGKARLYCCRQNGELAHTSYVIPKCYKFSFLGKYDYQIGPCFTYPKFRGKGYYPAMLNYISSNIGAENTVFYMTVNDNNIPSIKGIEKAGFQRCGTVKVTRITKRYRLE